MLHDIGKLILARDFPRQYGEVLTGAQECGYAVSDLEREAFGADHADLGAYLLGLWGLPSTLIEAVAFHHEPNKSQAKEFSILTAVHVANVLTYSDENGESSKSVDDIYLQSIGLTNELPAWRRLRQAALPIGVPA